ncbi:ubiquitin elongating factor core-domain-containing protein [Mycena olivaceomarginata]|nr:ubiquitin elongating factor core-domain-containing protein [Mycena olivaceomarginata]
MQRHLDYAARATGPGWGVRLQARTEQAINTVKVEMAKIRMQQLAFEAQLLDPELVFRSIVDPAKKAPPTPRQSYLYLTSAEGGSHGVPSSPPEYILRYRGLPTFYRPTSPDKSKINDVLFFGILGYGRERNGLLGNMLNTHPMALRHLMPALTHFYIEVEQTGASSQFYDKFSARWSSGNKPLAPRAGLNAEAARDGDKFVRFVNLMINDVTYLMDESLQRAHADPHDPARDGRRRGVGRDAAGRAAGEREGARCAASSATRRGYISLGRSTVELLKVFTAELRAPFMMPEIVDRLAAMLDYNLHALVGPKRCLSDIVQVFLNLGGREEFVQGRWRGTGGVIVRSCFERAAQTMLKRGLKTEGEVEQLRAFVAKIGRPIKSHLLSDAKDPFNRVPLTIDENTATQGSQSRRS